MQNLGIKNFLECVATLDTPTDSLFFSLDFIIVEEIRTFCAVTRYKVIIIIAFPGAFPSCLKPLYQCAAWCTIIYMPRL